MAQATTMLNSFCELLDTLTTQQDITLEADREYTIKHNALGLDAATAASNEVFLKWGVGTQTMPTVTAAGSFVILRPNQVIVTDRGATSLAYQCKAGGADLPTLSVTRNQRSLEY